MIVNLEILKAQLGGIQGKLNFASVEPFVKIADKEFRKAVGLELYDYLNEIEPGDTAAENSLLEVAQGVISWKAFDLALPHLKMRIGDLGMLKTLPANTTAVAKWEYADTRDAALAMVDTYWEFFWEELEMVMPDEWTTSAAYTNRNKLFLRSASELGIYVPLVGKNSRFFAELEKFIVRAENLYISETITPQVLAAVKSSYQNGPTMTATETALVEKIRYALAYLTLHEAYPYLPIRADDAGLREVRKWDGVTNESTAGAGIKDAQQRQIWQDAQLYLAQLKSFMDENATLTVFPEYYAANLAGSGDDDDEDFTDKPHILI